MPQGMSVILILFTVAVKDHIENFIHLPAQMHQTTESDIESICWNNWMFSDNGILG
jgi:hypothetical protein